MDNQKKILYIDLDGVIVDYASGFEYSEDNRSKWFFESMKPMNGAIDAVRELSEKYEIYILSTAPWSNPLSWTEKRIWVEKYLGDLAYKRLILSHNKGLLKGNFLIDDRTKNGVDEFEGEVILYGSEKFIDWNSVLEYLLSK